MPHQRARRDDTVALAEPRNDIAAAMKPTPDEVERRGAVVDRMLRRRAEGGVVDVAADDLHHVAETTSES